MDAARAAIPIGTELRNWDVGRTIDAFPSSQPCLHRDLLQGLRVAQRVRHPHFGPAQPPNRPRSAPHTPHPKTASVLSPNRTRYRLGPRRMQWAKWRGGGGTIAHWSSFRRCRSRVSALRSAAPAVGRWPGCRPAARRRGGLKMPCRALALGRVVHICFPIAVLQQYLLPTSNYSQTRRSIPYTGPEPLQCCAECSRGCTALD